MTSTPSRARRASPRPTAVFLVAVLTLMVLAVVGLPDPVDAHASTPTPPGPGTPSGPSITPLNDVTGVAWMEQLLTEPLARNGLSGGTDVLPITGAGPNASNLQ